MAVLQEFRDGKFRNRLIYAIAISVAVHEVLAGLWPGRSHPPEPPKVVSERVTIDRPTPKPTPKPTPTPVPTPKPTPTPKITPAPHFTFAPKITVRNPAAKAAATPTHKLGGAAAPKHIVHVTPPPTTPKPAPPASLAQGTHAGQQNGGSGTGAGAGNGTGGLGGSGTGTGTAGNGTGANSNTAPCGDVVLTPGHFDLKHDGSYVQTVMVTVRLRDGQETTDTFPYPFIYPNDAANPFIHDEALTQDGGVLVQLPPPGTDISKMPLTVQTVITHTSADGRTTFPECPGAPSGARKGR